MKSDFRKEWEQFRASDSHAHQARDRAWNRLEKRAGGKPARWRKVPWAIAAAVLLAWWLRPTSPYSESPELRAPQASMPGTPAAPGHSDAALPGSAPGDVDSPIPRLEKSWGGAQTTGARAGSLVAGDEQRVAADQAAVAGPAAPLEAGPPARAPIPRLVMNFRLPRSGVRLIWVKDENFQFGGGE